MAKEILDAFIVENLFSLYHYHNQIHPIFQTDSESSCFHFLEPRLPFSENTSPSLFIESLIGIGFFETLKDSLRRIFRRWYLRKELFHTNIVEIRMTTRENNISIRCVPRILDTTSS